MYSLIPPSSGVSLPPLFENVDFSWIWVWVWSWMRFYLSKETVGYLEAGMSNPLPAAGSGQCSSGGRLTALMLSSSETRQDFCCRTKLNGHVVEGGCVFFLFWNLTCWLLIRSLIKVRGYYFLLTCWLLFEFIFLNQNRFKLIGLNWSVSVWLF
jgi:hypothetical protein